jgi:hypothetical protein
MEAAHEAYDAMSDSNPEAGKRTYAIVRRTSRPPSSRATSAGLRASADKGRTGSPGLRPTPPARVEVTDDVQPPGKAEK